MTCNGARELIPLFVGGDLTDGRMEEVREHLAQCADCSGELQKFEGCRELIQELNAPEPTRSQVNQMWSAIRSEIGATPEPRIVRFSAAAIIKIAAVVVVGISIGYSTYGIVSLFAPASPQTAYTPMEDTPVDLRLDTVEKMGGERQASPRVVLSNPQVQRQETLVNKMEVELQELRRKVIELESQNDLLRKRIGELTNEKNK